MVGITIDARQLKRLEKAARGIKDGVPKVLSPSINRALNRGRTVVRREIRKEYLIKQKDIPIVVHGANKNRLRGQIVIKDGMLPLGKFKVTPRGVTRRRRQLLKAQVKKAGSGGQLPHAFNATMQGYTGPFMRYHGVGRLPIRRLITIGAPIMASQPNVGPAANKAIGDSLAKEIDRNMQRLLISKGGHS